MTTSIFSTELTKPRMLNNMLQSLDFLKTDLGWKWEMDKVKFSITMAFGNSLFLTRGAYTTNQEHTSVNEVHLTSLISQIEFMGMLYKLWAEVFTNQNPTNLNLIEGKKWIDYQRNIKRLIPPLPTVWAEREFLRYCLTYIERLNDWAENDYDVQFSQANGQLRISAKNTVVFCPARGNLIGEVNVSARTFYRHLPKRFISDVVTLQFMGNKLVIYSREFPARWTEQNAD